MDTINLEFQLFFQNAGILAAVQIVLIVLFGLLTALGASDLFAMSKQDKRGAMRNTHL